MSSPRPSEEKPEGLSKYIQRMRTVLRRGSSSKRASVSSIGEVLGGESSKSAAAKTAAPAQQKNTTPAEKTTAPGHWSSMQQEKARALFAKYGLTLEPEEWISSRNLNVERVEKPIRMRVRRTCHRCQTTFGPDKVCVNCQHVRCKKCARYPPAKSKEQKEQKEAKTKVAAAAAAKQEARPKQQKTKLPVLTIPSRTGGQDLVRKPIKQRVRRYCHRCNNLFIGGATECTQCKHIRCKKCPRDPPKLKKYPDGYPGDAEPPFEPQPRVWKKPRRRVKWHCGKCSTVYQHGQSVCLNCGNEKGPDTIREPPKKNKPEPDPEVVRRVEERLAQLSLKT
ncbi:hypothetical protein DTO027B5_8239 [Paecilomyces variotii]|nr:hypothetical protein DTO027B3_7288 [Paecilomyces variotii]KAJ9330028.1 hypothetical protein DTO027B5_8239 [Paecilomyces variotii]